MAAPEIESLTRRMLVRLSTDLATLHSLSLRCLRASGSVRSPIAVCCTTERRTIPSMRIHRAFTTSILFACFMSRFLTAQATARPGQLPDPITTPDSMWHPQVVRDEQALSAIKDALDALGGADTIKQIQSLETDGYSTNDSSQTFVWQVSGANYRMFSTTGASQYEINGGRSGGLLKSKGKDTPLPSYRARATFVPSAIGLLLYQIYRDPLYSVVYGGQNNLGSEDVVVIRASSQSTRLASRITNQTWYLSTSSKLPIRVKYQLFPDARSLISADAVYDFFDYHSTQGIRFPHLITSSFANKQLYSWTISNVYVNPALPSSLFAQPTGGAQ